MISTFTIESDSKSEILDSISILHLYKQNLLKNMEK